MDEALQTLMLCYFLVSSNSTRRAGSGGERQVRVETNNLLVEGNPFCIIPAFVYPDIPTYSLSSLS